jgi:hypothetical protein
MNKYKYVKVVDNEIIPVYQVIVDKITAHVSHFEMFEDYFRAWKLSEKGKFVMENSLIDLEVVQDHNLSSWGTTVIIKAEFKEKKLAEYYLKWGN